jgi:enoyl-[acyl-carrier protein] reductase I
MTEPDGRLLAGCQGLVLGVSSEGSAGFQCARALHRLGARVAVTCRPRRKQAVAELARQFDGLALSLEATEEDSFDRAFAELGREFGRLDFLVHSLVHVPEGSLSKPSYELSAGEFCEVMDVGVRSLLAACKRALPLFAGSKHPRVVALISAGAEFAIPRYHVVGIAKAALASAVRYLAHELGPSGVLCNSLSFSIIDTDAAKRVIGSNETEQTRNYLAKRSMTGARLEFEHVTNAVAFLASPLCSNLTGETLNVDGGFSRNYF